ncbi:hypothetical protein [Microbacterium marinilacus]|uniref:hypothetical protein n=1 Tax=Microbacterium marinilacus TaxID=415209 RepID=UPI001C8E864B|nr:hypothetical protein [Microbacterium marinilacus]MBY0690186.1 hypothetical protein [Microbacterium marinilacus]
MDDTSPPSANRRVPPQSLRALFVPRAWLLYWSLGAGFVVGLVITVLHDDLLPAQYELDALKIWSIARGDRPKFSDGSFTPVAMVYRALGMGDAPLAAALFGYLAATAVIVFAALRFGRHGLTPALAIYTLGAFALAGIYLGQYSKDVFVLPVIALLLLPRRALWDAAPIAAMLAYALWFRDYWAIVAAGYCAYRLITIPQVRVRYLLALGSIAAVCVSAAIFAVIGYAPNHYRTSVQGGLEANTLIVPLDPLPQPWGGLLDVFANYWLILVPLTLPFLAGVLYTAALAGLAFMRFTPLVAAGSYRHWPVVRTLEGVLLRRSLALLLAFAVVQALFEPDYGSVLRHLTPLLPLGLVAARAMRQAPAAEWGLRTWSWSVPPARTAP